MILIFHNDAEFPPELQSQERQIINRISGFIGDIVRAIRDTNQLELPETMTFRYNTELDDTTFAQANIVDGEIEVNPLISPEMMISCIVHELIHIEQRHVGWLDVDPDEDCTDFLWFGKRFAYPTTEELYINAPWERDAWRREPLIARKVRKWLKDSGGTNVVSSVSRSPSSTVN